MSGVKAKMIMNAVTSIAHANTGSRLTAMPGARVRSTATTSSAAAPSAAISATLRPMSQKSMLIPGECSRPVSGT